jgi:hypothetical protein
MAAPPALAAALVSALATAEATAGAGALSDSQTRSDVDDKT